MHHQPLGEKEGISEATDLVVVKIVSALNISHVEGTFTRQLGSSRQKSCLILLRRWGC